MQTLTETYKGYTLTTKVDPTSKGQSTLIYKGKDFIAACYADKAIECSVSKAKNKVDKKFLGTN